MVCGVSAAAAAGNGTGKYEMNQEELDRIAAGLETLTVSAHIGHCFAQSEYPATIGTLQEAFASTGGHLNLENLVGLTPSLVLDVAKLMPGPVKAVWTKGSGKEIKNVHGACLW